MSKLKLLTPIAAVTIGADPELFLCNSRRAMIPACGLIGGNKENPDPVPKGALQEDNVMAEFNIDPCLTVNDFILNINTVYAELVRRAATHGLEVASRASHTFPSFLLDMHEKAKEFGCEPDFNAYTLKENPTPDIHSNLRTCAGHVHLGFRSENEDYMSMAGQVVSYLDWIVGLWTVTQDSDTARRERYGKAGAFRPKSYGLEYRVPSNFWLKSDQLKRDMFNKIRLAYGLAQANAEKPDNDSVIEAINTHDVAACKELLGRYCA